MSHTEENEKPRLGIEQTDDTFESWIHRSSISKATQEELKKANFLIIPSENLRDYPTPVFARETERLLRFMKDNAKGGLVANVCSDDETYEEYQHNDSMLTLGGILLKEAAVAVGAELLKEYINGRIQENRDKDPIVEVSLFVEENGRSTRFTYKGPASELENTLYPKLLRPVTTNQNSIDYKV